MKIFKKTTFVFLCFALVFFFSGLPLTTSQAASDKGVLKEVVFVFRPAPDDFGKPYHGKPVAPCTVTTNDRVNDWGETGWHMPTDGLTYKINYNTVPGNISASAFQGAARASASTWTQADSSQKWTDGGSTSAKSAKYDGVNLVAFGGASGGIAVTRTWYWTGTGEVAESDMIFASNLAWSITNPGADCGGVAGTYDVQNIGTHEFGHQVGLLDLYSSVDKDLTMYGYGFIKELKKSSLGTGDISGARAVAP